jgi:hypothetical protein
MTRALLFGILALSAAACASGRPQARVEDTPTLAVPPVPPRVIEPVPATEPQAIEPVGNLPPATEPAAPKRPSPPRERGAAEKPEPKSDTPPDSVAAANPPAPVPPLRTATSPGPEVAQQQVRDVLDRARKMLESIDTSQLSQDRKDNHKAAWNFIGEAEAALKANNHVQAKALADRAENTAKILLGR